MQGFLSNDMLEEEALNEFNHVYYESGVYEDHQNNTWNEYEIIEDPNVDFFQRVKEENELTASSKVDTK